MRFSIPVLACFVLAGIPTAASAQARLLGAFDKADVNHDGKITCPEYVAARNARFADMDRNGDGVVSREDFPRLIAVRPKAGALIDRMIAEADANRDGKITRAELNAAPTADFDRADTNQDGVVDQAELSAMVARMRAQL